MSQKKAKPATFHTAAPWFVDDGYIHYTDELTELRLRFKPIASSHGTCVAWVAADDGDIEVAHNAALITAAPDLLDACEFVESWFDEWSIEVGPAEENLLSRVRAAIANATGGGS